MSLTRSLPRAMVRQSSSASARANISLPRMYPESFTTPAIYTSLRTETWPSSHPSGVRLTDFDGNTVHRPVNRIQWDPIQAEKGGYKHFMLKEIWEQPRAVRDTTLGRVSLETGKVFLNEMEISDEEFLATTQDQHCRLRHQLARRDRWKIHDRAPCPRTGRR